MIVVVARKIDGEIIGTCHYTKHGLTLVRNSMRSDLALCITPWLRHGLIYLFDTALTLLVVSFHQNNPSFTIILLGNSNRTIVNHSGILVYAQYSYVMGGVNCPASYTMKKFLADSCVAAFSGDHL